MSKAMVLRGICVSCKFGPSCVNHKGAAVMQCAQFEGCDYAPSHARHVSRQGHEVADVGLCTRCSIEPECSQTRLESGVWSCEEFSLN